MSDAIITVENLGKCYRISHQAGGHREPYTALRDVLAEKAKGFFKKLKSGNSENLKSGNNVNVSSSEDFWALKDVSFEIKRGEVVGIIGRNGAGKSTLLKILSRITEPTTGRVCLRGRVASLLEVGTGFHPELTGRENIFLNGAILGMGRDEIKRKFDEVVAFAEVEKFLDTPVKRYSSGMYVRLAFAVAAHLEPEILIVDEVLAVGDAEFQKKCLGKMKHVAGCGRTVLFVSHNMAAIAALTKQAVLLRQGSVDFFGETNEAVSRYINLATVLGNDLKRNFGQGTHLSIKSVQHIPNPGCLPGIHESGTPLFLELELTKNVLAGLNIDVLIVAPNGVRVGSTSTLGFNGTSLPAKSGRYRCRLEIEPVWLAAGRYSIDIGIGVPGQIYDHFVENCARFEVPLCNPKGGAFNMTYHADYGAVAFVIKDPIIIEQF